jgi:gluconolactonase
MVMRGQTRAPEASLSSRRLHPALDQILSKDERPKADYFGISEGPIWVQQGRAGYLLFNAVGANAIYKWTPQGGLSLFLPNSGYTGNMATVGFQGCVVNNGRLNIANSNPNRIVTHPHGRLIFCAQADRAIVRIESNGRRAVLAENYAGKRLNRPNDLVLKPAGAIHFTDPHFVDSAPLELRASALFFLKDGKVTLLLDDYKFPTGIAFSPGEKSLYVKDAARDLIMTGHKAAGRLTA